MMAGCRTLPALKKGDRFGMRTVVMVVSPSSRGDTRVMVKCDCGKFQTVHEASVRKTISCKWCRPKQTIRVCSNCLEPGHYKTSCSKVAA